VARRVAASVEAVLGARGDTQKLKAVLERSPVPMVIVDSQGDYVEVNRLGRLWFRLSPEEMRECTLGELTPAPRSRLTEQLWTRLLEVGSVAGRYPVYGSNGSRVDVVYDAVAHALPGLHLFAFAPADWPDDEPSAIDSQRTRTETSR